MNTTIELTVEGLGIILYSPWAVAALEPDQDYLSTHFWDPADVARHVRAGSITGVATGTPGVFRLHLYDGPIDADEVDAADYKAALALAVRDRTICVRDLYDLMRWTPDCPAHRRVAIDDGTYRVTAYTSLPQSGILGDRQLIHLHFERTSALPVVTWEGVPQLCPPDE